MKKISILLITAMSCSLSLMSCGFNNLQVPKEVKIKTDATYEFSLMNFDSEKEGSKLKISNYFDFEKILEEKTSGTSNQNSLQVYKYNNGSQFQQFLIHMPLKEIEFDFSESFKDMDFSKDMQDFNINKEFKVPAITTPERHEPINLDDVHTQINKGVIFGGQTGSNVTVTFQTITGQCDFSEITYASGYLEVQGVGFTLTGTVELKNGTNSVGDPVTFVNGVAKIPLANKTISKNSMSITFSDTGKTFKAQVHKDSRIKNATGITLTGSYAPTVNISDITFPFTLSENIKECEVTDGKLKVEIKRPDAWSAVIPEYTIALSGGLTASFDETKNEETLTNKQLVNGDIVAHSSVTPVISGATLDFQNGPSVYAKVTINKVTARIKLDDSYNTTITKDDPVPTSITDYVNKIVWNESGFDVVVVNDLPKIEEDPLNPPITPLPNNDITLTFESDFFNMHGVSDTIVAQGDAAVETTYEYRGDPTTTVFNDPSDPDYFATIPIEGVITLPGYQNVAGEKSFKVVDVAPGETYHLNITMKPVFNWETANVKLPASATHFQSELNTGMNKNTLFSTLGNDFGQKINIKSMPLYVFANIPPNMRNSMNFVGKISAFYGEESGGSITHVDPAAETVILDDGNGGYKAIDTTKPVPVFTKNDKEEITNNFGTTDLDFATAMNLVSADGTLCLDYDIKLDGDQSGGIDITSAEMSTYQQQGKSAVKIDIVLLLTMDFSVNGTVDIDMLSLANKADSDLLGRSEATNNDSIEKFLSVVKTASLNVDDFKLPMTGDISLSVDMYKIGNKEIKQVGNGETFALEVNPMDVIKTYPLSPEVKFIIGKQNQSSNFGILRTTPISGKIRLRIDADGEIPIYPFSDNN